MNDKHITVSVIIPMRNEERYIARCLNSILQNDYPIRKIEILVADGNSSDRSREIVANIARRHPEVRLVDNPRQVVPTGLNAAIRQSRGRYIIRMDAHSEYPPNYIRACVCELEKGKADVVGGRLITRPGAQTLTARAIALLSQHPFGVGNSGFRLGWQGRYVDTVPFGAFRREVFDRVGLFREGLIRHQDFELNARIRNAGGRIFLSPDIFVTYYNLPSISKLFNRAFRDGLWVARAWIRYPITFCYRHCAPLALFLVLVLPLLLSPVLPFAPYLSLAMGSTYIFLLLASSIQIAFRHGFRILFLMPLLFLGFHVACGAGLLSGLFTGGAIAQDDQRLSSTSSVAEAA